MMVSSYGKVGHKMNCCCYCYFHRIRSVCWYRNCIHGYWNCYMNRPCNKRKSCMHDCCCWSWCSGNCSYRMPRQDGWDGQSRYPTDTRACQGNHQSELHKPGGSKDYRSGSSTTWSYVDYSTDCSRSYSCSISSCCTSRDPSSQNHHNTSKACGRK